MTRRLSPMERLEQWFADRLSHDGAYDLEALRRECREAHAGDPVFLQELGLALLATAVTRAQRAAVNGLRRAPGKRTIEVGRYLRVGERPQVPSRAWWRPFADSYHVPFVDLRRPDLLELASRAARAGREAVWAAVYFRKLADLLPDDQVTVGDAIRPQTRLQLEEEIERRVFLALRDRRELATAGTEETHAYDR